MTPFVLPSKPGAVFFDAVGTLIHPEPSAPDVYAAVGRRHGSRLDAETIAVGFRAAFRRQEALDRAAGWRTDEARELLRWRAIVSETLTDASDPEACFAELYAHFACPDAWRVHPEVGPTLRALAGLDWRIGLASNFDGRLRGVAAGLPDLRPAERIVISSEVGWRKPAAAFFDAVRRTAAIDPEKIVFVGDDPDNDYEGARAAGLAAVLYDPAEKAYDGRMRIARLDDLVARVLPSRSASEGF